MSYTFDVMQQAVHWLSGQVGTAQAHDVAYYLRAIIDQLHDESHKQQDALNRATGMLPSLLETALRYEDDKERSKWLQLKSSSMK